MVLNGTLSYDPDREDSNDIHYNWTCQALDGGSCPYSSLIAQDQDIVKVPESSMVPGSFWFNLTYQKADRIGTNSVMLQISDNSDLPLVGAQVIGSSSFKHKWWLTLFMIRVIFKL